MASPPPHGKSSFPSPLEPDLDYNEEEEDEEKEVEKRRSSSHAHSRLLSEDGELASDEDGEIKEATPPFGNSSSRCKVERRSDESLQAGAKQVRFASVGGAIFLSYSLKFLWPQNFCKRILHFFHNS